MAASTGAQSPSPRGRRIRQRAGLGQQVLKQLRPQRERRGRSRAARRPGGGPGAVGCRCREHFPREPGLAHAAVPADHDGGPAAAGRLPVPQQGTHLTVPANQRRAGAGRGGGHGRRRRLPQARDHPGGLGGRADPELRAEPRGEPVVGGHRPGLVAGRDEQPDQLAGGLLVQRLARRPPGGPVACRCDVPVGLGRRGERPVRGAQPVPVLVPGVEHPVSVELAEQVAAVQRHRIGGTPGRQQPAELADVHQQPVASQLREIPPGAQVAVGGRPERGAQRPQRAAQAGPRAGVQDVRPQQGSKPGPAVRTRPQGEPGQQRAGAAAGRQFDGGAVELDPELAEQADLQDGHAQVSAPGPAAAKQALTVD